MPQALKQDSGFNRQYIITAAIVSSASDTRKLGENSNLSFTPSLIGSRISLITFQHGRNGWR